MKLVRPYVIMISLFSLLSWSCTDNQNLPNFSVLYQVTFTATWSNTTHPTDFPGNAHFSPMVGITHNSTINLFKPDTLATPGIKNMAETGSTSPLNDEILLQISRGKALDLMIGESFTSPGSDADVIGIDQAHPYVSVVSMIAPSPDWFIGVRNLLLYENNIWKDFVEVDVIAYDAGTDAGTTYTSADAVSNPVQNITNIGTPPLADGNGVVQNLGTIRFQRIQ